MKPRDPSPQDIMHQKIKVLFPNAVLSVRPYDNNEHLVSNPIIIGDMLVDWVSINTMPCPSLDEINSISNEQILQMEESQRKSFRDDTQSQNLTMIAFYEIEKKTNPNLSFSDYLDSLEAKPKPQTAVDAEVAIE